MTVGKDNTFSWVIGPMFKARMSNVIATQETRVTVSSVEMKELSHILCFWLEKVIDMGRPMDWSQSAAKGRSLLTLFFESTNNHTHTTTTLQHEQLRI